MGGVQQAEAPRIVKAIEAQQFDQAIAILRTCSHVPELIFGEMNANILHITVANYNEELMDFLVAQPYAVQLINQQDKNQTTPLQLASYMNNLSAKQKMFAALAKTGKQVVVALPRPAMVTTQQNVAMAYLTQGSVFPRGTALYDNRCCVIYEAQAHSYQQAPSPVHLYYSSTGGFDRTYGDKGLEYYDDEVNNHYMDATNSYFYPKRVFPSGYLTKTYIQPKTISPKLSPYYQQPAPEPYYTPQPTPPREIYYTPSPAPAPADPYVNLYNYQTVANPSEPNSLPLTIKMHIQSGFQPDQTPADQYVKDAGEIRSRLDRTRTPDSRGYNGQENMGADYRVYASSAYRDQDTPYTTKKNNNYNNQPHFASFQPDPW